MKLMAPRIEAAPARCSERMPKSSAGPGWPDGRERRIDGPAAAEAERARRALEEQRGAEQEEAGDGEPVRDVVHARERHVGRPDHQRHEPVAEAADEGRHDEEEHHDQAVAGDDHVEGLRIGEDLQPRLLQLHAHQDREGGADEAGAEREQEVEGADVLVVGGIHPPPPPARGVVVGVIGVCCVGHDEIRRPCIRPVQSVAASLTPPEPPAGVLLLGVGEPGGVVGVVHHPDLDRHVGVAVAAQLRALAVVDALALGLEPGLVEPPRHGVDLDAEGRHGEGVQHVRRGHLHLDHLVDRHDHLVVGRKQARLPGFQILGVDHVRNRS